MGTYVALTGGVGGAKLCLGFTKILDKSEISFIVNTGDDFKHLDLHISPDLDTLMYTLSGESNETLGWGRKKETWNFLESLGSLGGENWFNLGDKDLAVHVKRTQMLSENIPLSEVTTHLYRKFGIEHKAIPMSDSKVPTKVIIDGEEKSFQEYFVKERCAPIIQKVVYQDANLAEYSTDVNKVLDDPALSGIIICPSNPFLSIGPILSIPQIKRKLESLKVPIVAVSPIIAGEAIKGPTGKIMKELGLKQTAAAVADHYGVLISGFVLDEMDKSLLSAVELLGPRVLLTNTLMKTLDEKVELADNIVQFISEF